MAADKHTGSDVSNSGSSSLSLFDAAVVGAGLVGLATALELAQAGLRVVAFDRQQAMHEASWAAAGMLAANDPGNPPEILALSRYSLSLYPEFLARIHTLSGRAIPLRTRQTLEGMPAGHDLPPGTPSHPISAEEMQSLAPGLVTGGLPFVCLEEQSLDPCDLTEAVPVAARAAGIDLREHTSVQRMEQEGEYHRIFASSAQGETSLLARHVLLATGAWTPPLSAAPAPQVSPRKGQLVALQLDGPTQTGCVLRIPGLYIVPRGNGQYVVGATLEDAGFDQSTSEALLADLERRAAALWPPLARARRVAAWAGLRPQSPDSLPVLGPLTGTNAAPNLWVAMGHFRNGILQAPGTARILRDLILGHPPAIPLDAFRNGRFAMETV
jgi:glycine oxidase